MLNTKLLLPLYNWGIGTALIILFAIVCLALVLVVVNIMKNDTPVDEVKKKEEINQ